MERIYNPISVYRSANDNRGQAMSIAEFMAMGKDYAAQITAHRVLKAEIRQQKEELATIAAELDDLSGVVAMGYNPLVPCAEAEYNITVGRKQELEQRKAELDESISRATKEADRLKRGLPSATLSGLFYPKRAKDNLQQHSGFICVDLDDHVTAEDADGRKVVRPQSLDGVLDLCADLPWVLYAAHSVGGRGYFLLIPLGPIDAEHTHQWYFECLESEFQRYGLVIDPACSDVSRLRFLSYDKHPYRNAEAVPYMGRAGFVGRAEQRRIQEEETRRRHAEQLRHDIEYSPDRTLRHVTICVEQIEQQHLDVTGSYDTCIKIGMSLHSLGQSGLFIWERLCALRGSNHSQLHTTEELSAKWRTFGGGHSLEPSWFFRYVAREFGIYAKQQ